MLFPLGGQNEKPQRRQERVGGWGWKNLSSKSLRSYYGTQCAEQGVPPYHLQRWMGHRNFQTTMRYYIKLEKKGYEEQIRNVEL